MALLTVPPANRPGLFQSLRHHLDAAGAEGRYVGLILIDIKDFTSVNRVFDYKYGDLVLYHLAERLSQHVRGEECFFRLGSDEFALLVPSLENAGEIVIEANHIREQLHRPFHWEGQEINVDVNIGCIALPAAYTSAAQLLSSAEKLLQRAKAENRTICYGTDARVDGESDIWQLEQELMHALHNNELEMVFQPKIDLEMNYPVHAEALMRWPGSSQTHVSPGVLVEMIARLSREFELTKWALHTALRHVKQWPDPWDTKGVAVNIPANIVHHPDFRQLVEDSLTLWQVPNHQLTLEITENAILEDQQASFSNLTALKSRGIHISIDDFGTGYSSLQYFKTIPATELKIDQSFVLNMAANDGDKNIAQLIIELAHRFGLKVVAEGVEQREVLDELRALGCDYAQGYYIARPLSSVDYVTWLGNYQP